MKTTVDLADSVLRRAKRLASRRGTTLEQLIEDALRAELEREKRPETSRAIETHVVGGRGLQPGLSWGDWRTLRELAYEGRGG